MSKSRRVSRSEWSERVAGWSAAGGSAESYCAPRGWDASQLRWWRWKLRRCVPAGTTLVAGSRVAKALAKASAPRFLRLVASPPTAADALAVTPTAPTHLELLLKDGRRLRFDAHLDPTALRRLADALEAT